MEIRRALRIASLVGAAIAAAPRTGLAAGDDVKAGHDVRKDPAAMAVVAEHRYRMLASVRRTRPGFLGALRDLVEQSAEN